MHYKLNSVAAGLAAILIFKSGRRVHPKLKFHPFMSVEALGAFPNTRICQGEKKSTQ